jgi:hypothetical protein
MSPCPESSSTFSGQDNESGARQIAPFRRLEMARAAVRTRDWRGDMFSAENFKSLLLPYGKLDQLGFSRHLNFRQLAVVHDKGSRVDLSGSVLQDPTLVGDVNLMDAVMVSAGSLARTETLMAASARIARLIGNKRRDIAKGSPS